MTLFTDCQREGKGQYNELHVVKLKEKIRKVHEAMDGA